MRWTRVELTFEEQMPHIKFTCIDITAGDGESVVPLVQQALTAAGFGPAQPPATPKQALIPAALPTNPPSNALPAAHRERVKRQGIQSSGDTVADHALAVLSDGKPRTGQEVYLGITARGKQTTPMSVDNVLYGLQNKKRIGRDDEGKWIKKVN